MNRHRLHNIILLATFPVCFLGLLAYPHVRDFYWSYFVTKEEWRTHADTDRLCLARPIVKYRMLHGKTTEQILEMLGKPFFLAGGHSEDESGTERIAYEVGPGGPFSLDSVEILEFTIVNGVVAEAEVRIWYH